MELVPFPPSSGMPGMLQSGALSMMERQRHRSDDVRLRGLSLRDTFFSLAFVSLLFSINNPFYFLFCTSPLSLLSLCLMLFLSLSHQLLFLTAHLLFCLSTRPTLLAL